MLPCFCSVKGWFSNRTGTSLDDGRDIITLYPFFSLGIVHVTRSQVSLTLVLSYDGRRMEEKTFFFRKCHYDDLQSTNTFCFIWLLKRPLSPSDWFRLFLTISLCVYLFILSFSTVSFEYDCVSLTRTGSLCLTHPLKTPKLLNKTTMTFQWETSHHSCYQQDHYHRHYYANNLT